MLINKITTSFEACIVRTRGAAGSTDLGGSSKYSDERQLTLFNQNNKTLNSLNL